MQGKQDGRPRPVPEQPAQPGQFGAGETPKLAFASGLDAFVVEFFVVNAGDFDVDVDAFEERKADAFLVAGDGGGRAVALFDGVAVEVAGTPVRVAVTD